MKRKAPETVAECQAEVDRIEKTFLPTSKTNPAEIMRELMYYVDAADRMGVKSNRKLIVDRVDKAGWVTLDMVPSEMRRDCEKLENLGYCIVGNFIASKGNPPPNVMTRFCEEFLERVEKGEIAA